MAQAGAARRRQPDESDLCEVVERDRAVFERLGAVRSESFAQALSR